MSNEVVKIDSIRLDKIQDVESLIQALQAMAQALKADSIRAQVPHGGWVCDIVVRKRTK